jgi:CBS domain-containing protein
MLVSEILAIKGKVLYTIAPERPLVEAIAVMTEQDVGSLVCFAQGKMAGMLTFREVLNAVHAHATQWRDVSVAEVMVAKPFCASPDMDMDELRRLMVEHHQRYLPVMEGGLLMGVVSFHDVAKAVLEEQSFENKMLKAYIRNWPEEKAD